MPRYGEPAVSELVHQVDHVLGHLPLGRLGVAGVGRRCGGATVASKVWADDAVPGSYEQRCDAVPRGVGPRVPMQ
jgi:hypothetical protein